MDRYETTNLFGERVVLERRKTPAPKGYAAVPGSGPQGETCKSCKYAFGSGTRKRTYYKCELLRESWTSGYGTDILLKSPACRLWKAKQQGETK